MTDHDVIILGAGAAGLMCAATAGRRGKRVLVLDHAPAAGAKILISGGGRCNFTNTGTSPERFLSDNPHFCRSALSRYTPADFVALVRRHGIPFHEKTLGQLFCDGSAREVVAMLLAECAAAGVDVRVGHRVTDVCKPDAFQLETDHGAFRSACLVLATGGLSIPKMGATGFAYEVASRFGLRLTETRPGLVPLTFDGDALALMRPLSGVSLDCIVGQGPQALGRPALERPALGRQAMGRQALGRQALARQTLGREAMARPALGRPALGPQALGPRAFREAVLFTHRGLSGPAILQISSYWREGALTVDLLPGMDAAAFLLARKRARPKAALASVLAEALPARLAAAFAGPERMADVPDRVLTALAGRLSGWAVTPSGTEGYAKAEVTCGGVDTRDLSSRTMAANAVPGLFVIGEAVDVTGWLGGYNFQWAWASGWCAGEAV